MIRHITTKIEKTIKMEIRKLIINQSGRTKGKSTKIAQINSHYLCFHLEYSNDKPQFNQINAIGYQ